MNTLYKTTSLVLLMAISPMLNAADTIQSNTLLTWIFENIIIVLGLIIIITALYALWGTFKSIIYSERRKVLSAKGIELKSEANAHRGSIFKDTYDKAWSLIPIDKESEIELDHDYDGIKELDNSLPPWWVYLFYFTIISGVVYLYVYQFSDIGLSQEQEYNVQMEVAKAQKLKFLFAQANSVDETNVVALTDEKTLADAKAVFITKCASCHGPDGQGLAGLGPNFTDQYWKHGGGIKNVFSTIKYGVPEKGMISWQTQMLPTEMQKLASYILTLEGTNPPNPKDPEGTIWTPEEETSEEVAN